LEPFPDLLYWSTSC